MTDDGYPWKGRAGEQRCFNGAPDRNPGKVEGFFLLTKLWRRKQLGAAGAGFSREWSSARSIAEPRWQGKSAYAPTPSDYSVCGTNCPSP